MRKRLKAAVIGIAIVASIIAIVLLASRKEPLEVVLKPVARGMVRATVANTRAGTLEACNRARLSPAIGGQIARLPIKEGDHVQAGQLLLEMWNADRTAQVVLAEREADAANARAREACTIADVAKRESQRLAKLRKKGLSSEEAADKAAGEANAKAAACDAVQANARVSAARLAVAHAKLEQTRLFAPFEGIIAEITGEVGEFVTPSPIGVPTPPAVDLVDTRCLYVAAPIDEVDAPAIRAGMPAFISLDAFTDKKFAATVRRVAPYVLDREKQARTVDIEADFTDKAETVYMLPGYSADVEVILESRDQVLRIPTDAVLEGGSVLVYDEGNQILRERKIQTGINNWEYTEVTSGLQEGDRITVSLDVDGVEDGAQVVPVDESL